MNKFHTDKFSIVYLSNLKVTRMRQKTTIHFKNGLTLKNDRISCGFYESPKTWAKSPPFTSCSLAARMLISERRKFI